MIGQQQSEDLRRITELRNHERHHELVEIVQAGAMVALGENKPHLADALCKLGALLIGNYRG